MKKRLFAAGLWFYVGWYAAATFAAFAGLDEALGPITGALVASIVTIAPMRVRASRPQVANNA
jgi:hypothetical protein